MKVGPLSRSILNRAKSSSSAGYARTKNKNISITCHVPLSINYSLTTPRTVHKSTYCMLRKGIPLFLKGSPQVIEILRYQTVIQLIQAVIYEIQVWRKFRLLHSRYFSQ